MGSVFGLIMIQIHDGNDQVGIPVDLPVLPPLVMFPSSSHLSNITILGAQPKFWWCQHHQSRSVLKDTFHMT